jgi:MFS family permease
VRTYRDLFGVPEFRVLFVTQCLTMAAAATSSLALGTIVHRETGSAVLTGLSMFGGPLVALLASAFLLSASDLVRPRRALVLVATTVAVADLVQAVPGMPWPGRFALLAVVWLVLSTSAGAGVAYMADLLPPEAFVLGRATLNIAVGSMQILGYGLGGVLLIALSPEGLFLVAAGCAALAAVLLRLGLEDREARATGPVVRRTREVNRRLLGSPVLRPLYVSSWVPNGLIVGCEALFIPYAGERAGYLFATTAAGMLLGDVVVGRFLGPATRDRLVNPLRFLLAAPFLLFWFDLHLGVAMALGLVAAIGYADSLPLQERMVAHSPEDTLGQMLGLRAAGLRAGQALGALLAGSAADLIGVGPEAAGHAMTLVAAASIVVSVSLVPGLRRSRSTAPGVVGADAATAKPAPR